MDAQISQISELNQKVDNLHELIERLGNQIDRLVCQKKSRDLENDAMINAGCLGSDYQSSQRNLNSVMEHKDILIDGSSWDNQIEQQSEQSLSPDIQIRRLTAQLTAAYNRIAALEEQLLARRIH
ncbi:MAG: hypothetical protein QNJ54_11635 [Prochloraceae cyanobacterium]|nr:hypothetical protein [Prochloraceae cyanobacterium]